jgi:hypothetical protein
MSLLGRWPGAARGWIVRWPAAVVAASTALGVACTAGSGSPGSPGAFGTLAGRVVTFARAPAQPPGPAAASSVPGVTLVVSTAEGIAVGRVTTGGDGVFRTRLPAGTYVVTLVPRTGLEFTKSLPATVAIQPGHETWLDVALDSGVR